MDEIVLTPSELASDFTASTENNFVPEVWSGDGKVRTNEQMKEWAEKEGCYFEEADDKTLFIDVDTPEQLATFEGNLALAAHLFNIDKRPYNWQRTPSKSGPPHYHIRVHLPRRFSTLERVLLQACLGSDLRREMISMKRVLEGEDNVIVFFEKKETKRD